MGCFPGLFPAIAAECFVVAAPICEKVIQWESQVIVRIGLFPFVLLFSDKNYYSVV